MKRTKKTTAADTAKLQGMLAREMDIAAQNASEYKLPQTVVGIVDADYPFYSGASFPYEMCEAKGWTPIVTMLPASWFAPSVNAFTVS